MPGKEDTYHWALVVGPKNQKEEKQGDQGKGTRYHAKHGITAEGQMEWLFEEKKTSMLPTSALLVRVLIAKVENKDRLQSILRNTPFKQGVVGWNCVAWVQEALQSLEADGKALGTGVTEWTKVKTSAMEYCQRKREEHRFDSWIKL
ncbi:hypothetical protein A1F94_005562 [Pyrenophora tritici-repentis]|nr:hypothetical protein PtrV1_08371 [Pyrenophora tritici-repentis]KAF7449404.1 hypothetical protein A1F99_064530 [Pyrenophora tritici-repentis]KAG9383651.1 hypothetical protein A1F94_005562 [Pyrenophora tritici-repentis]KAI0569980.1 hypothetical protein Alg130_11407 [Pyrenophora tritici-repentis]KAI0604402.1 hypothetical protein TUN205_11351 [Pyrenophora tritici-repentis]